MRYRVKQYTIEGQKIVLNGNFTKEDIRLIVNETKHIVVASSMLKDNIEEVTITTTPYNKTFITIPTSVCIIDANDIITIEVDKGNTLPNEVASLATTLEQYCPGEHPNLFKPDGMGVWYVFTGELVDGGGYKCRAVHNTTGVPNYISVKLTADGATATILQNGVETTESYPISKENIKTVSLTAILDAVGNIKLDKSDLAKQGDNAEATNSAILDVLGGIATTMYKGVPVVHLYPESMNEQYTMHPNQYTIIHEATVSTNIVLHKGAETEGVVNHYMVRVENNNDIINSITFNGFSLKWLGGVAPDLGEKGTFEISIINDLALYTKV